MGFSKNSQKVADEYPQPSQNTPHRSPNFYPSQPFSKFGGYVQLARLFKACATQY